ncbi:hypothetical protein [Clostridium saccharobutylicum]|uniref:ABC-2 family transporter protein n=1 Tax=Clostridium saccharobutylicum DSM 13864 TaxID=1345695 RepID=U5MMG1_CLOSA|nr:hypothetical protein [Clostridium saccharobutylicum]AGX41969.1 hypothetical protein CLSA_c09580 [Clostridium saccharobutylicum DSM 13864]AQR89249.1 hypothetical protein CLOSC_09460 [Clostridium saccharobutylicum]AQR99150.1 hypothetical protein CSACC_09530 [Clostridium saccharobutylicum]AQS13138.1 hypothetical protein CLOSACC_09530 [Clostridium saccharobutylicum]MBA2906255.1 hypothetical protein [Clostridium saccharobutylicum]
MSRVFKYELKRLIINKFFLGLLIISAFYSHQVMTGDIILGVANTAPFSGWSYGAYLAKELPILLVALLFFISFLYSKQEKSVQTLTKATPIDPFKFQILRYGAIIIAFILISAVPISYSLWFYSVNFNFTNFGTLVLPSFVTLLPAMLFMLGLGILGGRYHQGIIFALMVVVILLSYVPLPYAVDLLGENFFAKYPEFLDMVEPEFSIPVSVIVGKLIFGLAGFGMMLISCNQNKK